MRLLLSKKETARLVGCHPEHLMRLSRSGKFRAQSRWEARSIVLAGLSRMKSRVGSLNEWLTEMQR